MAKRALEYNPEEHNKIVEEYASVGHHLDTIAAACGVGKTTFCQWKNEHPELDKIYKKAKAKSGLKAASKLMEHIEKGNLTAIIFYLKTQFRWKEIHNEAESDSDDTGISVDRQELVTKAEELLRESRRVRAERNKSRDTAEVDSSET